MSSGSGSLPAGQAGHAGGAGMARQAGRVRLQLRWHHREAGLAHGGGGGARNEGRLGLDARQPGGGGPGALLLLDAVILNQLGVLLLLLPDLQRPMKAPSFTRTSNCRHQTAGVKLQHRLRGTRGAYTEGGSYRGKRILLGQWIKSQELGLVSII